MRGKGKREVRRGDGRGGKGEGWKENRGREWKGWGEEVRGVQGWKGEEVKEKRDRKKV